MCKTGVHQCIHKIILLYKYSLLHNFNGVCVFIAVEEILAMKRKWTELEGYKLWIYTVCVEYMYILSKFYLYIHNRNPNVSVCLTFSSSKHHIFLDTYICTYMHTLFCEPGYPL